MDIVFNKAVGISVRPLNFRVVAGEKMKVTPHELKLLATHGHIDSIDGADEEAVAYIEAIRGVVKKSAAKKKKKGAKR
jgi:hypothetical protein